jgi:octaprenyl-diphosphate synthase
MGKSVGDDFREAKVTLPIILAYAHADEEARLFWRRVIEGSPQRNDDLDRAIAIVEATGAIAETRARAKQYAADACSSLAVFPRSDIRDSLEAIAQFCVGRGY